MVQNLRTQISQARTNISQTEQDIEVKRLEALSQKQKADVAKQKLQTQISKLPQPTQLNLRQKLFAGLEGRKRLQAVKGYESQLQSNIGEVGKFKEDVSKYEQELTEYKANILEPYKQEVNIAEEQLNQVEAQTYAEQSAYEVAKKEYAKNIPSSAESGRVKYYLQQFESEQDASQSLQNALNQINAGVPQVNVINPEYYNLLIKSGAIKITETPQSPLISPPRDLPRTDIIKDIAPINLGMTGFGIVSAQEVSPTNLNPISSNTLFYSTPKEQLLQMSLVSEHPDLTIRTTGSPMKIQNLQIDERTGKPFGTIEPYKQTFDPFSDIKRIGELGKEIGYFKAIPAYVGEQFETGFKRAFGISEPLPLPSGETLQTPATKVSGLIGTVGSTATYFTPAGIPLLIGGGVEEYVTPAGRERITQKEISLQEKGVPSGLSTVISYGQPVAEIGLGLWGLKGTKFDINKPIIKESPLMVDVKYVEGYGRTGKATERVVTTDLLGNPIIIEKGIPTSYISDIGITGYKKVVTTPLRELFGMKPIYSGTIAEQRGSSFIGNLLDMPTGYQKAYNLLKDRGYTDYGARQVLRQTRPQYQQTIGIGEMTIIQKGENQPIRLFTGEQTTTYLSGQKGGVNYLKKQPIVKKIDEQASYLGEGEYNIQDITGELTKGGKPIGTTERKTFDVIGFERVETKSFRFGESILPETLVKNAGKRTETFKGVVGVEYVKEVNPFALDIQGESLGNTMFRITPKETYARYKTADISQKIIPKERRLLEGTGIADISRAEPKITIYDESITKLKGFQGGGKKSSPQYLEQLYKGVEQAKAETSLSLIKTKPLGTPSPKIKPVEAVGTKSISPTFLAGTTTLNSLETSNNYGKFNMVSRLSDRSFGGLFTGNIISDFNSGYNKGLGIQTEILTTSATGLVDFSIQKESTKQGNILKVSKNEIGILKLNERQVTKPSERVRTSISELQGLKEEQIFKEALKEKQILKQEQKQKQRQTEITTNKTSPKNKNPPSKVPFKFFPLQKVKENTKERNLQDEDYETFVRRYGKNISIGEFKTQKEAEKALKEKLVSTLGASGFIERKGQKVDVSLGIGFRKSKIEPKRVVQEKSFRLGTGGEKSEIKHAKKSKLNKISWI